MKVFILCAGNSKRWTWETTSKFLVPVFNDRLLPRTVKQINRYGNFPVIVTHEENLILDLPQSCVWLNPENRKYTCQTLDSTKKFWDSKVIILLGDVLYSNSLIDKLFSTQGKIVFFGSLSQREIFALTFTDHPAIIRGLEEVSNRTSQGHHGQLWQLFYSLNSLPAHEHPPFMPFNSNMFSNVTDFTQDFDSVEDYKKFLKGIPKDDKR